MMDELKLAVEIVQGYRRETMSHETYMGYYRARKPAWVRAALVVERLRGELDVPDSTVCEMVAEDADKGFEELWQRFAREVLPRITQRLADWERR